MRSVLDRSDREDVRLHQPCCANASAFDLRGYVDTLSLSLLCITMILCVRRIFFEITTFPNSGIRASFYALMLCSSRTQVSCGRYKSYCLSACHTLVQRYCEMKRPGPTLRVRLRETGFTVASTRCLKVTGGCLSLSLKLNRVWLRPVLAKVKTAPT